MASLWRTSRRSCAAGSKRWRRRRSAPCSTVDREGRMHPVAAPSLPQHYSDALDGIMIGPGVGSCGTAAHTRRAGPGARHRHRSALGALQGRSRCPSACKRLLVDPDQGEGRAGDRHVRLLLPDQARAERHRAACGRHLRASLRDRHRAGGNPGAQPPARLFRHADRAAEPFSGGRADPAQAGDVAARVRAPAHRHRQPQDRQRHDGPRGRRRSDCAGGCADRRRASPGRLAGSAATNSWRSWTAATSPAHLRSNAERILAGMEAPFDCRGHTIIPQVTIGGVLHGRDGRDMDTLRQNADFALYHAKERGRGRFVEFSENLRTSITQRIQKIRQVEAALGEDRRPAALPAGGPARHRRDRRAGGAGAADCRGRQDRRGIRVPRGDEGRARRLAADREDARAGLVGRAVLARYRHPVPARGRERHDRRLPARRSGGPHQRRLRARPACRSSTSCWRSRKRCSSAAATTWSPMR